MFGIRNVDKKILQPKSAMWVLRANFLTGIVAGAVMGLCWAAITPAGKAIDQGEFFYSVAEPELIAAQDAYFAVLAVGFGLVHALVLARTVGQRPMLRVAWACFAGVLGSLVAWLVGSMIGPLQVAAEAPKYPQAVTAPLGVHSLGVLFIWSFVCMMVASFVFLAGSVKDLRQEF